jgi:hypothetical protein
MGAAWWVRIKHNEVLQRWERRSADCVFEPAMLVMVLVEVTELELQIWHIAG